MDYATDSLMPVAVPSFATPRTPSRLTVGPEVLAILDELRTPAMPWQKDLALVANEIRPDLRGFAYPIVIAIVPRRAGKSHLVLAHMLHRAQNIFRSFSWYTSQTRMAASEMFTQEWMPLLDESKIKHRNRLAIGSESIVVGPSRLGVFPPNRKGLHSKNSDLVVVDEAWAHDELTGREILAGATPTTYTRPWSQIWIVSAGGDENSTWLEALRKQHRPTAEDTSNGVCYLEFSPPEDAKGIVTADLDSPATWQRVHPAVGHTIDLGTLQAEFELAGDDKTDFYRAILNVFDASKRPDAVETLLDPEEWKALAAPEAALDADQPITLTYEVAAGRRHGSIVLAQRLSDGRTLGELVDHYEGTGWIAGRVLELADKWGCDVVCDSGAAETVTHTLADLGFKTVRTLKYAEMKTAVAELTDGVRDGTLVHRGQAELADAVEAAIPRWRDNGRSCLIGSSGAHDTSPLSAFTVATWAARHRPVHRPPSIVVKEL